MVDFNDGKTKVRFLFLAAGYGTRLQRDVRMRSLEFAHLLDLPKALVPMASKPLLTRWLSELPPDSESHVVTNAFFYPQFVSWARTVGLAVDRILNDLSFDVDGRLGAIGDLQLALDSFRELSSGHVCVVASDTLFLQDFDLSAVLREFYAHPQTNLVLYYTCSDVDCQKTGILDIDDQQFVCGFIEKPHPSETPLRNACPCFYLLHRDSLSLVSRYLASGLDKDSAGKFIKFSYDKFPTRALQISGRLDVGDLQSYIDADAYVRSNY